MNSDDDELYMKSVALVEIYNFVVPTFFYLKSYWAQIIDMLSRSYRVFEPRDDLKWRSQRKLQLSYKISNGGYSPCCFKRWLQSLGSFIQRGDKFSPCTWWVTHKLLDRYIMSILPTESRQNKVIGILNSWISCMSHAENVIPNLHSNGTSWQLNYFWPCSYILATAHAMFKYLCIIVRKKIFLSYLKMF
jgi:hypothetical protein